MYYSQYNVLRISRDLFSVIGSAPPNLVDRCTLYRSCGKLLRCQGNAEGAEAISQGHASR